MCSTNKLPKDFLVKSKYPSYACLLNLKIFLRGNHWCRFIVLPSKAILLNFQMRVCVCAGVHVLGYLFAFTLCFSLSMSWRRFHITVYRAALFTWQLHSILLYWYIIIYLTDSLSMDIYVVSNILLYGQSWKWYFIFKSSYICVTWLEGIILQVELLDQKQIFLGEMSWAWIKF